MPRPNAAACMYAVPAMCPFAQRGLLLTISLLFTGFVVPACRHKAQNGVLLALHSMGNVTQIESPAPGYMFNKQRPMRPETDEEIARYRKLGLIFTTRNPLLEGRVKKEMRLSSGEISFCKKHKLGIENYIKIKSAFIRNGRQSVINIFRRNRLKISKCDEVIEFLTENIK